MKQITREQDLIGKTIKSVHFPSDEYGCLIFTDDTFAFIKDGGYDLRQIELVDQKCDIAPSFYNYDSLYEYGLISKKERDKLEIEKNWSIRKQKRDEEIALLKKLQEKHPDIR